MPNYDFVIVGAGAAGCVLANRLTEDPSVRVALIESGPDHNSRRAIVRIPLAMVTFMAPSLAWMGGPKYMQWFETEPEHGLDGRRLDLLSGRGSAGSTLVDGQIYIRGQREDFDGWRDLGNPGLGFDDLLPYFRRLERFEPLADPASDRHLPARAEREAEPPDPAYHGATGDLNPAHMRSVNLLTPAFLKGAALAGHRFNPDFNGARQDGFGLYTFTQEKGERVTAESAYIDPIRERLNLDILSERTVTGVIMDGKRATGVAWRGTDGAPGETAGAEVILSAGSFVTPHLLLLSGIGDKDHLSRHGVPVVHHLPGIAESLQDHLDVTLESRAGTRAPYGASCRALPRNILHTADWLLRRRGLFASTTAEGGAFLSTTGSGRPDVQLFFCTAIANTQNATGFSTHGFLMHVCQLRPQSVGTLKLKSADPSERPSIQYNFFQGDSTTRVCAKGSGWPSKLSTRRPFSRIWIASCPLGRTLRTTTRWTRLSVAPPGRCFIQSEPARWAGVPWPWLTQPRYECTAWPASESSTLR